VSATKTTPKPTIAVPTASGYDADITLFASRYKQGGRTVYGLDLSLAQVASLITPPDPNAVSPGNRAIRPAHADAFAKYIREREDWVMPGMILRAPGIFKFEVQAEVAGVQFGIISFPRLSMTDLHILDGQHRILGIFRAQKQIGEDLDKARSNLALAKRNDPKGRAVTDAQERIAKLDYQRKRLDSERASIQIFVEEDPTAYRQMFFDIADNALGITASVKSRFDSRKVVNRALAPTMEHPLLTGRVDPEGDRVGRGSMYLLGAKHVAEVIRTVNVGLDGRVSRRQEEEFSEHAMADKTKDFFDMLVEAFPPLRAITLGQLTTDQLRRTSLLGSVLFIRILAGVYHDLLSDEHHWAREDVEKFFEKLAPHLEGPAYEGSIWLERTPDIYSDGSFGPRGRRQDLAALKAALVGWALDKPKFLDAKPKARPARDEDWVDPEVGAGYTAFGADIPEPV
jgi:hypothetical protein